MAKYYGGILGRYTGKIGSIVASTWKGIEYVRGYVVPSNPKSTAQTAWRAVFQVTVLMARTLLSGVIQPYWDPLYLKNSGFAEFMKVNLTSMSGGSFDLAKAIIAYGTWGGASITDATYAGTDVTITWDTDVSINKKATDKAVAVVVDLQNNLSYIDESAVRSDGSVAVTIGADWESILNQAFLFFVDETGETIRVSTSNHSAIS